MSQSGFVEAPEIWSRNTGSTNVLVVGDLNRDGLPDLVVGNGREEVGEYNQILYGNGLGGFLEDGDAIRDSESDTRALALGDVDNDGWAL